MPGNGLIVTWDVFEFMQSEIVIAIVGWLIVTWDVFEYVQSAYCSQNTWRLIVTWDVFEYRILENKC